MAAGDVKGDGAADVAVVLDDTDASECCSTTDRASPRPSGPGCLAPSAGTSRWAISTGTQIRTLCCRPAAASRYWTTTAAAASRRHAGELVAADLDGDGDTDLAATGPKGNTIAVLRNRAT